MSAPLPTTDSYALSAILERFEDRTAVLSCPGLGQFKWPIKNLPENLKPGDAVILKIVTQKTEEEEKYTRMRKLLEDLIN